MKKVSILALISFACTPSLYAAPSTRSWADVADTILASIIGLGDALANDSLIYDNLRDAFEQLYQELTDYDMMRQDLFASIRSGIDEAQAALQNSTVSSAAALAACRIREQKLLNQLAALRLETEAEIAYLNRLLADISNELIQTKTAYDTLLYDTETKTADIIQSLSVAYNNYEAMVTKRTNFLDLINTLAGRVQENMHTTLEQTETINQKVWELTDAIIES